MASQDFSQMIAKTEEQMADIDCPTLCELDKSVARDFLMGAISFFSNSLNQTRAMTPEQIKVMAYDMVDEFPNDSIVFIKLFFKKARTGAFGNIYGTVDELTILDKYRKYRREVVAQFPMRKAQPKAKAIEAQIVQEDDGRVSMPEWLIEKWGVNKHPDPRRAFAEERRGINPRHDEFMEKLKEAKSKQEKAKLTEQYLNS